jgi:hypothetical protein
MTWPAAKGKVPRAALLPFSTTARGQKARLKAAYARIVSQRRRLGVTQAYWYTWATQYDRNSPASVQAFRYSGLTRLRAGSFRTMPILRTYASVARRYEGCRKTANARRCRR